MADRYDIRLPAIRIRQGSHFIYCFGVDGKRIHDFAAVSRVHRDDDSLQGYQRPEVLTHIKAIRRYLESDGADAPQRHRPGLRRARDASSPGTRRATWTTSHVGELVIPVDESLAGRREAGLAGRRTTAIAAIRDADLAEFPVAAVGFIAKDEAEQRSQFILVNNTKPLPKGLIHELLPDSTGHLPPAYARKQLPAEVMIQPERRRAGLAGPPVRRTHRHADSAGWLHQGQQRPQDDREQSVRRGALPVPRSGRWDRRRRPDPAPPQPLLDAVVAHTSSTRRGSLPPRKSRLTHGVGIQSMGYVMDHLTEGVPAAELGGLDLERTIAQLESETSWTAGSWDFGPDNVRRWNGLQNTPSDVRLLSNHLLRALR